MSETEADTTEEVIRKKPDDYLYQSIIVMFLCFFPVGVPALVFASRVNVLWEAGEYDRAESASRKAKNCCWVAFVLGVIGQTVGWITLFILGVI